MSEPERTGLGWWLLALLFAICVGVQVNDPDPLRWMAIYGVSALLMVGAARGRSLPTLGLFVTVAALLGAMVRLPALAGPPPLETEEGRELLGLLMVAAAAWASVHDDWVARFRGDAVE